MNEHPAINMQKIWQNGVNRLAEDITYVLGWADDPSRDDYEYAEGLDDFITSWKQATPIQQEAVLERFKPEQVTHLMRIMINLIPAQTEIVYVKTRRVVSK